ncbi:MAG: hypothetical protein PF904_14660 [Kiritimatiellae bacterium]|jgi:hypothetical protein|nr:hypothetical protein [Kiritimatiellia bacterium]
MNKKLAILFCCMVLLALSAVMCGAAEEVQLLPEWDSIESVNLKGGSG